MAKKEDDRFPTRIRGLDTMLNGGFFRGSIILVTGTCGAGKSTFGMEFLYNGVKHNDEPGVYISLEEEPKAIIKSFERRGWNIRDAIKKKKLIVFKSELYKFDSLKRDLESNIQAIKAKRVVIDTISTLGIFFEKKLQIRRSILELGLLLKKLGCTTMITTEIGEDTNKISAYGAEEFVSDAVIVLYYLRKKSKFFRAISVRKIRGSDHSKYICPFKITKEGILISPNKRALGP